MMNDCGQCGAPSTEVIVDVNGWLLEVCHRCALVACDPLGGHDA
jgi:hypothetical protein